MASKFGLAGGIPERRVRPIWDAIDSRQFKNALKLSASLLSKCPNSPYALALKALVLERMGKSDEALSICLNAKDLLYKNDSLLMDDLTLSTLQIVFQRLDHLELATICYEHACSKFPNNMELMMGLFNCYVREYSFVKQQQVAIKMYKLVGEERFLLWAVCSIQLQGYKMNLSPLLAVVTYPISKLEILKLYLQPSLSMVTMYFSLESQMFEVLCGNGGEKLLLLAEGLLRKHISSHSLHEPEAIIVYISILEQQAKYGDVLEILSGKLGSLLMIEVDKLRIQGRLLARSGDYASGAKIYQKILELSPDDWECFLHYLGCLLEDDSSWSHGANGDPTHPPQSTDCKVPHLADEVFDSRLSEASAFVQKLQLNADDGYIRCPYLATLEIIRRKHFCGKASYDDMIEALRQYFSKFGHLACFTSDVEVFVEVLTPDKRMEFVGKLAEISCPPVPITTKVLGSSITIFRMKQLMGNISKPPIAELEGSSRQMVMYWKSLPLSKDLDPQESMHGEELLSMACSALVQTRNLGYLIEAVMVLEFGLTIRRYVWQHKILLLHLYANLGALSLAYEWYKTLDVKNILMETVSHHIIYHMLSSPLWANLSNLLQDYLRFMDDHFRESADLTFLAYRHRNYSKVIEFVQFKEKLQQSNQYLVARVETSILQLKQKANNIEEEKGVLEGLNRGIHFVEVSNEIRSKNLNFNEDFQTRPWWSPVPEKNYLLGPFEGISYCPKDMKKDREEIVRRSIERKSLLPRLIYLSIQSSSVSHKENSEVNGSTFDPKVSSELKFLLEQYAKMLGSSFIDAIEVVKGVSTGEKSCEAFGSDMIEWLNFSVFLNAWNLNTRELSPSSGDHIIWNTVDTLLQKCITDKVRSVSSVIRPPSPDFPVLVQMVTEPLAWHGLILQSCNRSTLPSGKKKKKAAPSDNSSTALTTLRDSVESSLGIVEEVAKSLRVQVMKSEDGTVDAILSLVGDGKADEGPGCVLRVIESSRGSADEAQLGSRVFEAVKSWSPADVARKIGNGTKALFSDFLQICGSKVELFRTLKQQLSAV